MSGKLFVCATPIGNLEDVTLRLLRVLAQVDLIAAEDTRRTRKLLTHHGISARLVSYHEHNERTQAPFLLEQIQSGFNAALVTDAGMPGISDPGYQLIAGCIERAIPVEVIPGPSAILPALVLSGLPTARFCFEGFLPRKQAEQRRRLQSLEPEERTLVFFESAARVRQTLESLLGVFGDRRMALARELTKIHEEVVRGTISEVLEGLAAQVKGEIVLVVEGRGTALGENALEPAVDMARRLAAEGSSKSKAAAEAAASFKVAKRLVYDALLGDGQT